MHQKPRWSNNYCNFKFCLSNFLLVSISSGNVELFIECTLSSKKSCQKLFFPPHYNLSFLFFPNVSKSIFRGLLIHSMQVIFVEFSKWSPGPHRGGVNNNTWGHDPASAGAGREVFFSLSSLRRFKTQSKTFFKSQHSSIKKLRSGNNHSYPLRQVFFLLY